MLHWPSARGYEPRPGNYVHTPCRARAGNRTPFSDLRNRCVANYASRAECLAGVEPASSAWKAESWPLGHRHKCVGSDELCSTRTTAGRSGNPFRVSNYEEHPAGVGPAPSAWQAVMQPLTPRVRRGRSESRTRDNSLCRRAPCRLGDPAGEEAGRVELPAPEGATV